MLQNDMKKGQLGVLTNGWKFRIEDNKKGNIRMATVWGFETEMGSIYTRDISFLIMPNGTTERLEKTSEPILWDLPNNAKQSAKLAHLMRYRHLRGSFGN